MVLPTNHPLGDFAYCSYAWTSAERRAYEEHRTPPVCLHHLPRAAPVVPFYVFTRDSECDWHGPRMRAPKLRRLDSCAKYRLLLFDLFGTDAPHESRPLAIVPSEDVQPTASQRQRFERNLNDVRWGEDFPEVTPPLDHLLCGGRILSDYYLCASGPLVYEEADWRLLWSLLSGVASPKPQFEHPPGVPRDSSSYRHSVQAVHELTLTADIEQDDAPLSGAA